MWSPGNLKLVNLCKVDEVEIFYKTFSVRCLNSVGAKASLWSKFADGHKEKQSLNPFSESFDKEKLKSLLCSKDDPNYGRPDR